MAVTELLKPQQRMRKSYTDFHSLATKLASNLIQDNQATVLLNFEAYRHDLRRRQGLQRHLGPPSKPRLMLSHEDLQARKWMLSHCEDGEIYFTRNVETAVAADWIKCQISGQGNLGLNTNYLPSGCSFNGAAYFVNGFNGTVKFSGDLYVTVPPVPACRIIAPGPRRIFAIGLISAPEYMRMSALDDGDRWSGPETATTIYSKTQPDFLPDVGEYLYKVGLSGDHVLAYWKFRKIHVFFGARGIYAAIGGLDPFGRDVPKEQFNPFRLTSQVGCLNGRSVAETPDGLLIWQGSDGQLYVWTGEFKGAAGEDQWGTTIFCLTEPTDPVKPNIANLMDFNNGGYKKPEYDLSSIGADSQAEWVAGTTKTNVDTATKPGTLLASKDASTIVKKENYEGTVNSFVLLHGTTREFSQRFKCTETGNRSRAIIKIQHLQGPRLLKWQVRTDNSGPPSDTILAEGTIEVNTTGDYQLTIDLDPERLPYLTLNSYYHIVLLGYAPLNELGLSLKCVNPGAYTDGSLWVHYNGTWIEETAADIWFQFYGAGLVYQASSTWHHYYDKGDATSAWGLLLVEALTPPNTTLTYYLKCAATAAEVDTAAEITEAVTNGESIAQAKFGGDNPANRFVGIKIVATTTTPFDKTWEVYYIKASFVVGSVASALGQAAVYNRVYHLSLMEQTLVVPWNPSGVAASVNNAILTVDRNLGFRILRGFKADETNQTDFAFNALVSHNGRLYGALANPIGVGGSGYTTGVGKVTSGGSGSGCTVNISTVDTNGMITAVAAAPTVGGTGYAVGDYLLITTGGSGGYVRVTAVNAGVVTAVSLTSNYLCRFDVDQEFDLINDADHKILAWWDSKDDDFGYPAWVKIYDEERLTREELGSDCPFQMEYALDGGSTFYLLGFSQKELKTATTGCILTIASAPTAGGAGYVVGDFLSVNEGTGGIVRVATVVAGVVTEVTLWAGGSGHTTGAGKATTALTGSGTGCTINIQTILSGYGLIYAKTNTLGAINTEWKTVSPSWPKTPTSSTPYYQDRICYPNKVVLEPSYEAHRTVGNSLKKRLKTTNKIRLQSLDTVWRPKADEFSAGGRRDGGYKVEEILN